ncbi:MAG: co-chaperone DjlA [endosymbiont of Galathealinum brachiosum]|uniref:Co-chaperone DjlA n=1 Tax=endosymbiont of Galathealinum brachiosum TaxID=2200906 RepID=A0A370D9I6_9GAMM|nr:MAG: co-chaperone DjlA [endosymbiont of Galathealinum brachiosum]
MPRLADVVTQTFRSISPDALTERLFRDPLARWWQTYQEKLEASGYDGAVQGAFFISSFAAMGHVAKCDGRVKSVEIELATQVMDHLDLTSEQRQLAIRLFNEGKHEDFTLETLLWRFKRQCSHRVSVVQVFIEIQLKMAYADASLNDRESKLIKRMCKRLDVSDSIYTRIERRVRAEKKVANQPIASVSKKVFSLSDSYEMLGVNRWANQEQVKQAYRRMMSKFHPDKLVAKGASEVEVVEAHDIVHDIKNAYEMLIKSKRMQ